MTLRYIFHSGFLLETEHCILIFDYWLDHAGVMSEYLNTGKHVYVFASHFHRDHFSDKIFQWKSSIHDITYILSKDILRHRRASEGDADVWMAKGSVWEDGNLRVTATGSNDSGVSWVIETELSSSDPSQRKTIFHAGDLCNWYARFLSEEKVPEKVVSEEFGEINPVAEEKRFLGELKDIRKVADHFDLVMFPVDGRIGNGYTLGARQFIDRFRVGTFVPMHFVASGFESSWRMEPFCREKGITFWSIREDGERLEIR